MREADVANACEVVLDIAKGLSPERIRLPWIDDDEETKNFVEYWFGETQAKDLRRLAFVLHNLADAAGRRFRPAILDILRIALSRIIITKEQCASLARDTSHSRPHRVTTSSDYRVFDGFERSVAQVQNRLLQSQVDVRVNVKVGDARKTNLRGHSVDAVITSPPYLNAIDYMRGHRLALVWLGFRLSELRTVRSNSIGAERAPDTHTLNQGDLQQSPINISALTPRYRRIVERYAKDVQGITMEIARVLRPGGLAIFVIGNSCLNGVFIRNAELLKQAAQSAGLNLIEESERDLPPQNRYLPISSGGALGKRMRTETILTFAARRKTDRRRSS
jgi:hypothetical protein